MEPAAPLRGRVAVITGGGGGIGREAATHLATLGASVVVSDIDAEASAETARAVEKIGGRAVSQRTDVTSRGDLERLVELALARFGRLDVMFNNAGIAVGGALVDWTPEQYERVIAVNQTGVFYGIQAAAGAMQRAGNGGVIINTGSVYGRLATSFCIGYQAAKAAVEIMTQVAARELAPDGIRVVNVAPGVVDTPMIDAYRRAGLADTMAQKHMRGALVSPTAVARVVGFLATDAAQAVNGTTVYADDGYSSFK